jgi:hypothetical protein
MPLWSLLWFVLLGLWAVRAGVRPNAPGAR